MASGSEVMFRKKNGHHLVYLSRFYGIDIRDIIPLAQELD